MSVPEDFTQEAKRVCECLNGMAAYLEATQLGDREVNWSDARVARKAGDLLTKFDTEIYRLRQAIGCYLDDRLTRADLRKVATTWNAP